MQKSVLLSLAVLTAVVCLCLIGGGIYVISTDNSAAIKFKLWGGELSSTSTGFAMVFVAVLLLGTVFRSLVNAIIRLGRSGGAGGRAEVEGDGEAYGGKGGNSGSFGPGGRGGDAIVKGTGKAKGGAGGNG